MIYNCFNRGTPPCKRPAKSGLCCPSCNQIVEENEVETEHNGYRAEGKGGKVGREVMEEQWNRAQIALRMAHKQGWKR